MIDISSMEYAFSKLDFKKAKKKEDQEKKKKLVRVYYKNAENRIATKTMNLFDYETIPARSNPRPFWSVNEIASIHVKEAST